MNYFKLFNVASAARAVVVSALAIGLTASVSAQYYNSYNIDINTTNGAQPITNIMLFEQDSNWGATTWAFGAPVGQSTLNNPFSEPIPEQSFMIGLTQNLPGDADGQYHVVFMMDPTVAGLTSGTAWGEIFRDVDENNLVQMILHATDGLSDYNDNGQWDYVNNFANNECKNITGIDSSGNTYSAWFNFGATGGSTFDVETWSGGQIIGTGTTSTQPVPEPAAFGAFGLGCVGFLLRRRK